MRINRSIEPGERWRGEGLPEISGSGRCVGGEHKAQSGQEDRGAHLREKMKLLLVHRPRLRCAGSHMR